MIGNDIVDLAVAKNTSKWQHPRFLDKIFSLQEQYTIGNSKRPFVTIWRLWSMKEAAYKLYAQLYPSRFFKPKQFECAITQYAGIVNFKNFTCYLQTRLTPDFILSEATINPSTMQSTVVTFHSKHIHQQSIMLNECVLQSVAKHYAIERGTLQLKKDTYNIPRIETPEFTIPISLTHHGRYGAFVNN